MKKIEFILDGEEYAIFIREEHLLKINNLSGKFEKGGYIFASKIKNTNEYIIELLTNPHKKDVFSEVFIKLSNKHKKIAKNIWRKNSNLYEIGFYHTHPESFGCEASTYDLNYFSNISKKYKISIFIIGISNRINIFAYSYGNQIIKEYTWKF